MQGEVSKASMRLAYRHLYQHVLRAVKYATPARYNARDRLRAAFRTSRPDQFHPADIARTMEFLDGAARYRGIEHRIVKNLLHVDWTRGPGGEFRSRSRVLAQSRRAASAYTAFDETIRKLNATMGICL